MITYAVLVFYFQMTLSDIQIRFRTSTHNLSTTTKNIGFVRIARIDNIYFNICRNLCLFFKQDKLLYNKILPRRFFCKSGFSKYHKRSLKYACTEITVLLMSKNWFFSHMKERSPSFLETLGTSDDFI